VKLYIANGTKQVQSFWYRLPGSWAKPIELVIPQGMQVKVPDDLLPEEVESILDQHSKYGLIKADEVDRSKPFTGLCYSIDKPVAPPKIEKLFNHNQKVLEQRTEENLMTTALATDKTLVDTIEETSREARKPTPNMRNHRISITEVPRDGGSPRKTNFFRNGKDESSTIKMERM
jgi:hypothetical protein